MTHAVKTYNAPTSERRRYVSELETEQRQAFMRQKFMQQSRFHKAFGVDALEIDCSPYAQVMRSEVIRILGMKGVDVPGGKLEELHLHLSADHKRYGFDDGVNKISALLYDTDNAFEVQYMRLLSECVRQHFKYPFYFQATPTIRIHCPDAENSHHYPRYHTDINYGHPVEEINIWIPLTMPIAPQQHGFRMMSLAHSQNTLDAFGYSFTPFIEYAINDAGFNRKLNDI